MTVTEIALLHLRSGKSISPSLAGNLLKAQEAQEEYSKYPVRFFSQVDDPSYIYLLGGWDSVTQHMEKWIPSSTNQTLLELLKDEIDVLWMFHVDVDCEEILIDVPNVTIGRYLLEDGGKDSFQETSDATNRYVSEFSSPRPFQGGRRIDKEDNKEEFVLFMDRDDVAHHMSCTGLEGFHGFPTLRDPMDSVEIRHAVRLSL
jgi:hypothetical protein